MAQAIVSNLGRRYDVVDSHLTAVVEAPERTRRRKYPVTKVEVTMVERADGRLRLARVAAIIAADQQAQAERSRGLAA